MTTLLGFVILVVLAYVSGLFFERTKFKQTWLRGVMYSGSLYILLGFVIGPHVLELVDDKIIKDLNLIYTFVLGWVGFLIGLQMNVRGISRFTSRYYLFALFNLLFVLALTFFVLKYAYAPKINNDMEIFIFCLAGAVTSPILVGAFVRDYGKRGRITHLFQFSAAFDNVIGVVILGLFMALISNVKFFNDFDVGVLLILILTIIALLAAYFFKMLTREFTSQQEYLLLLIGLLLMVVGSAFYLKGSLLFSAFIFGAGISNFSSTPRKLFLSIQELEKPLYILLLIFAGTLVTIDINFQVVFLIYFLAIHLIAKIAAGLFSGFWLFAHYQLPKTNGLVNVGLGGLSLAILLDFHIAVASDISELFLFILIIAIIINDFIGFWYLDKVMSKFIQRERDA